MDGILESSRYAKNVRHESNPVNPPIPRKRHRTPGVKPGASGGRSSKRKLNVDLPVNESPLLSEVEETSSEESSEDTSSFENQSHDETVIEDHVSESEDKLPSGNKDVESKEFTVVHKDQETFPGDHVVLIRRSLAEFHRSNEVESSIYLPLLISTALTASPNAV